MSLTKIKYLFPIFPFFRAVIKQMEVCFGDSKYKFLQLMHNYNPLNRYSLRTRVGNWSQEWDLEQTKRKEYMRRRHEGTSNVSQKQRILTKSYQSASVTFSKDNARKFGDHVMLFNGKVEGFLVTDIFEKTSSTQQSYNVSAVKNIHACARSVFILQRADPSDGFKDSKVHFGQQVRIRLNPLLIDKPIYLYSEPYSVSRFSKVSRLQQVLFMLKNNFNTNWIIDHPDPNQRLQSVGKVVSVDDTVLFRHEMTNQWLAADNKVYQNTFGKENEVMVHNFLVKNKTQNLIQEKKGQITVDTPARSQTDENLWLILGASSPEQDFDESVIKNEVVNKFTLEKKVKYLLTERGVYGMRFLHKVLRCLDVDRKGQLEQSDFRWGLQSGKIFLNEEEVSFLIKNYGGQGKASYRVFLNDLRGKLSEKRSQSIVEAYKRVLKLTGGKATLQQLGKAYDARRHPEVLASKKSEKQAFNQFIWSWDNIKPDYTIELQQFAAYFEDISCMIPRDDHFEYLLLSVFHL